MIVDVKEDGRVRPCGATKAPRHEECVVQKSFRIFVFSWRVQWRMNRRRLHAGAVASLVAVCSTVAARDAAAQPAAADLGRIELSVGASWLGAQKYGSADATETTAAGGTTTLFKTSTELGSSPAFDARVGVRVAHTLVVEADTSYTRPQLRVTTAADVEGAAGVTAVEQIQQFSVGGGATWYVPTASRLVPFVTGGGGYLRQLHAGALLVDTGSYYEAGGGVVYVLAAHARGWLKITGLRFDARAMIFSGGVAIDGGRHAAPAVAGSFFVRF